MAVTDESRANTETDVTQLLEQFLAGIVDDKVIEEAIEPEPQEEVVICEVQLGGLHYKLTCRPCQDDHAVNLKLSPREQEIVRLIMNGLSTRGIASALEISPWTVTTHLRRVFSKLSVNSRAEMVACVMREGILEETKGSQIRKGVPMFEELIAQGKDMIRRLEPHVDLTYEERKVLPVVQQVTIKEAVAWQNAVEERIRTTFGADALARYEFFQRTSPF